MKAGIEIYCDGSCLNNPGPGGWAALLITHRDGKPIEKLVSGGTKDTTNNRMEITAAMMGLKALTRSCEVTLYSDSSYVIKGMSEWMTNWLKRDFRNSSGRPIENQDLWKDLVEESSRHKVHWKWVRGHSGHPLNERVDEAARKEAINFAHK